MTRNRGRQSRLNLSQEETILRTGWKRGFSLIAFPTGALDEITEVEIKLALETIVGHGMFCQFATVPFQLNR
jgi:hypothetical protein